MKRDDGKILRTLILIPFIIILGIAVFQRLDKKSSDNTFRDKILAVDTLINQGRVIEAADSIRGIDNTRLASYQYLQLLRRCRTIDRQDDSYSLLLEYSRAAAEIFPRREEFWAVYAVELLNNGQARKAAEMAADYISTPRFLSIHAQALLEMGTAPGNEFVEAAAETGYAWGGLLEAVQKPSADTLSRLGTSWNIPEFKADAAILCAEQGEIQRGVEIIKNAPLNIYPELALQLAYDAGDSSFGIFLIQRLAADSSELRPLYLLYQAQFLFEQGHYRESIEKYNKIISADSEFSVIPYLNSYLLDEGMRVDILERGLECFPDSTALMEQLGEGYFKSGRYSESREIYTRLNLLQPDYIRAAVRLREMADGAGSKGSEAVLWDAYHNEEYGETLALMLAWKLYGLHDVKGLELLTARQEKRQGPDLQAVKGLFFTSAGRYREASGMFQQAFLKNPGAWEYLYNKGLIDIYLGEYEHAVDAFHQVDIYLNNKGKVSPKIKSMVWLALGEAQIGIGDIENGKRSLDYALDLDSGNLKAALLRRSITP